jgi:uncharacterized membrane protein
MKRLKELATAIPRTISSNVVWMFIFMALLPPCMAGCLFIAAAYVVPAVLHSPISTPRNGMESLVQFMLLFGGMAFGVVVAIAIFGLLTYHLLSAATYRRWVLQFQKSAPRMPRWLLVVGRYLIKALKPRSLRSGH